MARFQILTFAAVATAPGFAALGADRHQAAEAAGHLPGGDFMSGEIRQAGIEHVLHPRMVAEMLRDRQGARRRRPHARKQGAHAAQQQPGLERAQHAAELDAQGLDALPVRIECARDQRAGDDVGMALRYFVAECITRSAPRSSGRVNTGVATVESTAKRAPAACAIWAAAAISVTASVGLPGVSIHTSAVRPGCIAAR
ncbi:MAG: hypothetical protein WDN03_06035 [Rhizomicrobium sp.]